MPLYNPIPIACGVGKSHPNRSRSRTQGGMLVLRILISSTDFASTSFRISVVTMSRPASCWFCCPTNCCVFSLPARTFAFTEVPSLLEKGLRKDGIEVQPASRLLIRRVAIRFFMYHPCGSHSSSGLLTHPYSKAASQSSHAHRYQT